MTEKGKPSISIIDLADVILTVLVKSTRPFYPVIKEIIDAQKLFVPVPSWLYDLAFIAYVEAF